MQSSVNLIKQLTKNEITYHMVCAANSNSNNNMITQLNNYTCTGKKGSQA